MGLIKDFEVRRWLYYPGSPNGTSGDRRSEREGGVKRGGDGADITMSHGVPSCLQKLKEALDRFLWTFWKDPAMLTS